MPYEMKILLKSLIITSSQLFFQLIVEFLYTQYSFFVSFSFSQLGIIFIGVEFKKPFIVNLSLFLEKINSSKLTLFILFLINLALLYKYILLLYIYITIYI